MVKPTGPYEQEFTERMVMALTLLHQADVQKFHVIIDTAIYQSVKTAMKGLHKAKEKQK